MPLDTDPRFMPLEAWDDTPILDDAPAPEIDPRAEIEALDRAAQHVEQVARLRHAMHVQDQVFQRAIDRIQDKAEARRVILQRAIDWHLAPLRQLHEALLKVDPKRKTIELPHGDLKMRVPEKPQVFIDDQAAVVEWAREAAPDLLPPPDRVKVTDLRSVVLTQRDILNPDVMFVVHTATGEVVPGVHAEVPAATWNADTEVDL